MADLTGQSATGNTRNLLLGSGDPGALIDFNRGLAQNVAQTGSSAPQSFNIKLMDLLKRYQQMGTRGFAEQNLNAQSEQVKRLSFTDPALIGANPGVQNSVRGASVGAVEPTISSAQQSQQTFGEQLGSFGNTLKTAQDVIRQVEETQSKQREELRTSLLTAAQLGGSTALEGLLKTNPQAFKAAGLDAETLITSMKAQESSRKQKEDLDIALKLKELNKTDGEGIDYKTFEMPDGSKRTWIVDKKTGAPIQEMFGEERAAGEQKQTEEVVTNLDQKLKDIKAIYNDKGMSSAVGTKRFWRTAFNPLGEVLGTTGREDFVGKLSSLTSGETLQGIIKLKAAAGGIGTLSDQDIKILQDASSAINAWARKDEAGNITHYQIDTGSMRRELEKLYNATERLKQQAVNLKTSDLQNMENIINGSGFNSAGKPQASTPYLKTLGTITGYGSPVWKYGLDVDLKKGDPVKSPVSGKIIASGFEKGWGNTVKIQDVSGQIWRMSHFDKVGVKPGQTVNAGQVIALGGNTGTVIKGKSGDGSHLDITIYRNGQPIAAREVKQLLDRVMV